MNSQNYSYAGDGSHTSSYYAASANVAPERPELTGDHQIDVCIVGAGYTGLSTGLYLAEKGYKVAIIEGARVGWGASGRNGGQIVNGLNASLQTIKKRYGQDTATFVAGLVQEGGEIIRERISTYNIKCDLKEKNIFTGLTSAHMGELEQRMKLWASYGLKNQEMLDKNQLREHVNSDLYVGGLIDYSGGHMHPLNLALGEAAAFEQNGGIIYEMSPVIDVDHAAAQPVVKTAKGTMTCKTLVLCGNAYLGHVVPTLTSRVMPVSTQVMATEPLGEARARELIPTDACVEDIRYILDYYRLSGDNRMLFGGGTVYGGADPSDIKAKLQRNMDKVFPQLKGVKIDYAWSGNFALSFSRVPQMGRIGGNTYFAHGYSGHGVTGSHTFGRILAEAIHGDLTRFDVFAKVPWYPFPGGRMFRVPYSVMGSWWYGVRDKIGI
ncbi:MULTISPECIES: FAD-binding oxidoreductase [unclassified Marinobacter]|jgi:gamma-glutamylputrescine oxidase|uniref:NAD(P)/FAD-dependent oxidoreductase n=1 Tax=unclassified Marinobacter TaxID=83889 RepID=UPI00200CBD18|nr:MULTISPECIES: FAD-binding oxidoreductase [unclassified Marinobacter]MCL1476788.1 FAD-binding oxidoreductase [Marinobacter sp.]MCL1479890.1 FAD-binding oxidoreductase [Marinobacter sp.]MCL1485003.1 FAD-binding oxidoreductase [Marinobacter sp.]UQG57316.1 FAD-binding oxidoreductase [Marinobacter sp. M4C]UQG66120.1 FAD-binding oxidoreductase [Marinobacter sp. M2C]